MVTVWADGCAPIVQACTSGAAVGAEIDNPHTVAAGLRVPKAIADFLMLDILRRSGGTAVSVSDAALLAAVRELGQTEGIFAAPEGAACVPALKQLLAQGTIRADERVVLFHTGAGLKYPEPFQDESPLGCVTGICSLYRLMIERSQKRGGSICAADTRHRLGPPIPGRPGGAE